MPDSIGNTFTRIQPTLPAKPATHSRMIGGKCTSLPPDASRVLACTPLSPLTPRKHSRCSLNSTAFNPRKKLTMLLPNASQVLARSYSVTTLFTRHNRTKARRPESRAERAEKQREGRSLNRTKSCKVNTNIYVKHSQAPDPTPINAQLFLT